MAVSTAAKVFEHYYQEIVFSLPMKDVSFVTVLMKHNLLPSHIKANLELLHKCTEKASNFLDWIIKPELNDNIHTSFVKLLTVMMECNHDTVKELAAKIKVDMLPVETTPAENGSVLFRLQNGDNKVTLDDIHTCYEAKASKPQLKNLQNIVSPSFGAHWRTIGHQLGLGKGLLDIIDYDHHLRAEDCCNAVWEQWLDMDCNASWNKVIEAVRCTENTLPVAASNASDQLKKFYKDTRRYKNQEDDWPSYQPDHFTNVALIHHSEKHVTTTEVIAVANVMHKGEVYLDSGATETQEKVTQDYFLGCNSTKDVSQIFNLCNNNNDSDLESKVILIEGAPGIGKTILSKEIAYQWAKGTLLVKCTLLFLIYLRDPRVKQIQTLEQFICLGIGCAQKNATVEVITQYLENTSGEFCTIVLDGYDELSDEMKHDSFFSQIIHHQLLRLCNLVITSRPTASTSLHNIIDLRVEILGFAEEDRNEYINQSLKGNAEDIKKIKEYLNANPFVNSLCYIPLNMTILMCLLKSSLTFGTELPKSQTEINKQFTLATIQRDYKRVHSSALKAKSLQNLPSPQKQQLKHLSKLAFVFLGKDKIVFSADDVLEYCPNCICKWNSLGLLKEVEYTSFLDSLPKKSYNFLHFSIQEFLAAFYMASKKESKQVEILKESFWNERYLNTGIMYCGLASGNMSALKRFLSDQKSFIFSKLFGTKGIAQDTYGNRVKCLHLFQCFLEAGNNELAEQVGNVLTDGKIDLSYHTLLSKDCHSLSFFLTRSTGQQWKLLNLSRCYIGDNGLDTFSKAFTDLFAGMVTIETINFSFNHLTSSSVNNIIKLIHYFNAGKVIFIENNIINHKFDDALFSQCIISSKKITRVHIENIRSTSSFYFIDSKLSEKDNSSFLHSTGCNCNLYFWNTNFHINELNVLMTSVYANYQSLCVYEECVDDKEILELVSELESLLATQKLSYLEYVLQSNNKLFASKSNLLKILSALKTNFLLKCKEDSSQTGESFSKLHRPWKTVHLNNSRLNNEDFQQLASYLTNLCVIIYLDILDISNCSLNEQSINAILEILKSCIIQQLVISGNFIPNTIMSASILKQVSTETDILNFKHKLPLTVTNCACDQSLGTPNTTRFQSVYLINCSINKQMFKTGHNHFETSSESVMLDYFLLNNKMESDDIYKSMSLLCKNSCNIHIFELNILDKAAEEIESILKESNKSCYSFVLSTNSKIKAYQAKCTQIDDALKCSTAINAIELINSELNVSCLSKFLLNNSKWDMVDISGCNIGDEGFQIFCQSVSYKSEGLKGIDFRVLNLSRNGLSSSSTTALCTLLQFCIVENMIISSNMITIEQFKLQLHHYFINGKDITNFVNGIPLTLTGVTLLSQCHNSQTFMLKRHIMNFPNNRYAVSTCNLYITCDLLDSTAVLQHMIALNASVCNIYIVDNAKRQIHKMVTLLYTTNLIAIEDCVIDETIVKLITTLNKQRIDRKIEYIELICISSCKGELANFNQLCQSIFNGTTLLKHIKTLNISLTQTVTSLFLKEIIALFQYCIVETFMLYSNNVQGNAADVLLAHFFTDKQIMNFKCGIPLIMIKNGRSNRDRATIYLANYKTSNLNGLNELYRTLSSTSHCQLDVNVCILDCFRNNEIQLLLDKCNFEQITVFENNVLNQKVCNAIKTLTLVHQNVHFVVSTATKFVAYNAKSSHILLALTNKCLLASFWLHNCDLSESNYEELAVVLSTKYKHLKDICISNCTMRDDCCKALLNSLFCNNSLLTYIKKLDISFNQLTMSMFDKIFDSLQYCVVEHLIILNNNIQNRVLSDTLIVQHYCGKKLLNFSLGIPLKIINCLNVPKSEITMMIFLRGIKVEKCILDVCNDFVDCEIDSYIFFLIQSNVMVNDLHIALSSIYCSLPNNVQFCAFEAELLDDVAMKTAMYLNEKPEINTYILMSKSKLLITEPHNQLISKMLTSNHSLRSVQANIHHLSQFQLSITISPHDWKLIDFSKCHIGDKEFEHLWKCFSHKENGIFIEELNLSDNCLTSTSILTLVKLLQFCIIKRVIIANNNIPYMKIKDAIFKEHCKDKIFNFLLGVPLIIITNVTMQAENIAMVFLRNCKIDNVKRFILSEYRISQYMMFFFDSDVMVSDISNTQNLLQNFVNYNVAIFVYELNLLDAVVMQIATYLNKMKSILAEYILVSQTELLAYKSHYQLINEVVLNNNSLQTLQLHNCNVDFSTVIETGVMSSVLHKIWNTLDLTGCNIGDHGCLKLLSCLSKVSVNVLNLSQNELSSASATTLAKLLTNCSVQNLIICFNCLRIHQICDSLTDLFYISSIKEYHLNVIQHNSTACIMCNMDGVKLVSGEMTFNFEATHYWFISCLLHEKLNCNGCGSILCLLNKIPQLSSLHLHNNCLELHEMKQIITELPKTDLFFEERDLIEFDADTAISFSLSILINESLPPKSCNFFKDQESIYNLCFAFNRNNRQWLFSFKAVVFHKAILDIICEFQEDSALQKVVITNCFVPKNLSKQMSDKLNFKECSLFSSSDSVHGSTMVTLVKSLNCTRMLDSLNLNCVCFTSKEVMDGITNEIELIINLNPSLAQISFSKFKLPVCDLTNIINPLGLTSKLRHINLSHNSFNLEAVIKLSSVITTNPLLEHFDLCHCQIPEEGLTLIVRALKNSFRLMYIDISHNNIVEETAVEVASVITNNKSLEYFNVSDCNIQEDGIKQIAAALASITKLIFFDISKNYISEQAAQFITATIQSNTFLQHINFSSRDKTSAILNQISTMKALQYLILESVAPMSNTDLFTIVSIINNSNYIKHLNLSNNNLDEDIFLKIMWALKEKHNLQYLNLASTKLTKSVGEALVSVIYNNVGLKHLNLSMCKLPSHSLFNVVNVLSRLSSIKHLDLSGNIINDQVSHNLSDVLKSNNNLGHLNFANCKISSNGCTFLSSFNKVTSLQHLNLQSCCMNEEASQFVACVIDNCLITHLNLSDCNLSERGIVLIAEAIIERQSVRCLSLSFNNISVTAAQKIAMCTRSNPSFTHLLMSHCSMNSSAALKIAEGLCHITSLEHLDLSYNTISSEAALLLSQAILNNPLLVHLDLKHCSLDKSDAEVITKVLKGMTGIEMVDLGLSAKKPILPYHDYEMILPYHDYEMILPYHDYDEIISPFHPDAEIFEF